MSASVAKRTPKAKKPTAKEMAALLLKIEQERAQRVLVEVELKAGAKVCALVSDCAIAEAIYEGFKQGDKWIDFVTVDGGWVRLPHTLVQQVVYKPGSVALPI